MSKEARELEADYLAAEHAGHIGGPRALVETIASAGREVGEGKVDEEARRLEEDHAVVDIIYKAAGPAAAVKALVSLRDLGKKK